MVGEMGVGWGESLCNHKSSPPGESAVRGPDRTPFRDGCTGSSQDLRIGLSQRSVTDEETEAQRGQ